MDDTRYCPRFISGLPREDPEFYLKDEYWNGVSESRVIVKLAYNDLTSKIVAESIKRKIPVTGETPEIQESIDQFITGAASN